jgi:cytochrome c biogenesis protein CcmG/thiol:disulfide interchange protein DsbE
VALVNVFASWCIPCRAEHPILMRLGKELGVTLYGISYKDKAEDSVRYLHELGNPYQALGDDADGRVGIDWGVYGVPETFIVDRDGRIRHKQVGPITPQDLQQVILPLIAQLSK